MLALYGVYVWIWIWILRLEIVSGTATATGTYRCCSGKIKVKRYLKVYAEMEIALRLKGNLGKVREGQIQAINDSHYRFTLIQIYGECGGGGPGQCVQL